LLPLKKLLREGNPAQQWLKTYELDHNCRSVIIQSIADVARQEMDLIDMLATVHGR
jgi:hypothetical protein